MIAFLILCYVLVLLMWFMWPTLDDWRHALARKVRTNGPTPVTTEALNSATRTLNSSFDTETPTDGLILAGAGYAKDLARSRKDALPSEIEEAIKRNTYGKARIAAKNRTFALKSLRENKSVAWIVTEIDKGAEVE